MKLEGIYKVSYNNPQSAQVRSERSPLTIEQVERVAELINTIDVPEESDADLLQHFIHHFENLDHHATITNGLWATDQPDKVQDPEGLLFQIESFK